MVEMESPRRSKSSPEFEFWMVGNNHPELEHPDVLHTADELFVDGVLLPLHLLSLSLSSSTTTTTTTPPPKSVNPGQHLLNSSHPSKLEDSAPATEAEQPTMAVSPPESSICSSSISSSKRWRDIIFKKKDTTTNDKQVKSKERKNNNSSGGGGAAAELNINIWPFSRSWSAGSASTGRPKPAAGSGRKASSAPCSRSNSGGGGGRRWAASPGRPGGGVHVGRASPVWRRAGKAGPARRSAGLNLNANSCIGYRNSQMSCRGEADQEGRVGGGSLSKFRALFSKKVY